VDVGDVDVGRVDVGAVVGPVVVGALDVGGCNRASVSRLGGESSVGFTCVPVYVESRSPHLMLE
jgi:hypothetical protein